MSIENGGISSRREFTSADSKLAALLRDAITTVVRVGAVSTEAADMTYSNPMSASRPEFYTIKMSGDNLGDGLLRRLHCVDDDEVVEEVRMQYTAQRYLDETDRTSWVGNTLSITIDKKIGVYEGVDSSLKSIVQLSLIEDGDRVVGEKYTEYLVDDKRVSPGREQLDEDVADFVNDMEVMLGELSPEDIADIKALLEYADAHLS